MAIIDSQINLVNLEFSGDTESVNKDTNNLFIDILKAVKDGQDQTGDLSGNTPISDPQSSDLQSAASQNNTTNVHVIADGVTSEEQAMSGIEPELFAEQTITDDTNRLTDNQHVIEQPQNTVVGRNNELATSQGTIQNNIQNTLHSQEKAANTLLSKLSKSQSYTVSINRSEPPKMSDFSANENQQSVLLNASLSAFKTELSQLVEQQGDADLTIQQIKPVMQKMEKLIVLSNSINAPQGSQLKTQLSSSEQEIFNSQNKAIYGLSEKVSSTILKVNRELNEDKASSLSPKRVSDDVTKLVTAQLNDLGDQPKTEALARFVKDDLKPLLVKLSQISVQNQEKENLNKVIQQVDIENMGNHTKKSQIKVLNNGSTLNKDALSKESHLSQQALAKINQQALMSPDAKYDVSNVKSISDAQDVSNTVKGQLKNTGISSDANDMPKISKEELTPLLKKIDTLIAVDGNVSKQENINPVTSQLQSNKLSKLVTNAEQIAINTAALKQKNNQNAVPDTTRFSNLDTFDKLNVQDVDSGSELEQFEQPISFSKLLGTMKNNASTSVLSQLMTQVQSAQLQQSELVNFEQQQVTQQVTQLTRRDNQAYVPAEQGLQNSTNIARSEVTKALFDKANMMLNLNLKEAEIRLDPAELGSMQIRLRSDAEQAQINFIVQNQTAKELLEQTMSKLKEMLAEQGIDLGESSVSEHGSENEQQASDSSQELSSTLETESQNSTNAQIVNNKQDGIDFYA